MNGSDSITITTYWLDWLLLPIMLGVGWLTYRWARVDSRLASNLKTDGAALSAWAVSIPLIISAAGWVILGFASLIKEEYWELRIWCGMLFIWSLCSFIGAWLIFVHFIKGTDKFGIAGILNLIGLVLMPFILCLPAIMDIPYGTEASQFSHIWTILLFVCLGCLLGGMLSDFPYNFPRFPLGICIFSFFGLGAMEVSSSQPALPWLPRLWKPEEFGKMEQFLSLLPKSNLWQIDGVIKLLVGIGAITVLIIAEKLKKVKDRKI